MIKRITTYQHNGLLRLIETLIAHITEHTYYSSFLNLIKRFSYGSIRPFLKPDYLFIHQQIFGMGHRLSFYNRNAYHIRIIKIHIVHIKNTYTLAVTAHQSFCPILAQYTMAGCSHALYHRLTPDLIAHMRNNFNVQPTFGFYQSGSIDPHIPVHQMTILH